MPGRKVCIKTDIGISKTDMDEFFSPPPHTQMGENTQNEQKCGQKYSHMSKNEGKILKNPHE